MSTYTVLATPRSFAKHNTQPLDLLKSHGCQVIRLPRDEGDLYRQLLEYLPLADGIIAGLENYDATLLNHAKKLKVISRYGVGVDNIDLGFAFAHGIIVTNTPGANSDSVADLAVALMLCAARHICPMNESIHSGKSEKPLTGIEMWKKTLGVIGTGKIGKGVIERVRGFRMKVLAYDAFPDQEFVAEYNGEYVNLDTLFSQSDFITLHAPLNDETENIVNAQRIGIMKKNAVLINTARGGLVDEEALFTALKEGVIAGAALDACLFEPACGSKLSTLKNCILTPHAGASTLEAGLNMGMMAAQNLLDVLTGIPCANTVSI